MPSDNTYAPRLPDAVRRASERADQLAREAGVLNVPPLPEGSGDNLEGGNSLPVSTTVGNSEGEPASPAPAGAGQPGDNQQGDSLQAAPPPIDFEARFNTLQGKYNSECAELRGHIRSLEHLIATMQQVPRAEPPPAPAPPPARTVVREISPADVEAWGPDLVEAAQRWAEVRLAPRLEELERRVMVAESGTQNVMARSAAQMVEMALDQAVPHWREINDSTEFHTWLNQVDPFSGRRRQELLTEAHRSGESARTAAIFRGFLNEQTAVSQPAGILPNHTGAPPADRLPLEVLAVPGRGPTAPLAQGAPEQRQWTGAQITQFYRQKQRGMWAGREDEEARLEADIIAAGREGRVR
jgi:hypothetical protein